MSRYFFILTNIFLVVSCTQDNIVNSCSDLDPVNNLQWLKLKINELEQMDQELIKSHYVSQAEYNSSTIFIFGNCCHTCNTVIQVYNCDGELIGRLGCGKDDINFNILEEDKIIWKSPDFKCTESDNFGC